MSHVLPYVAGGVYRLRLLNENGRTHHSVVAHQFDGAGQSRMTRIPKIGDLLYYGLGNRTDSIPFSLLILSEPIQEDDGWRIWVLRIGGVGAKVYCGTFQDFERFEYSNVE